MRSGNALLNVKTECESDANLRYLSSLQDSMGGSPNDIRISDMRPTLVEPPMYKPKVVLLGKEKKGTTLHLCSNTEQTQ